MGNIDANLELGLGGEGGFSLESRLFLVDIFRDRDPWYIPGNCRDLVFNSCEYVLNSLAEMRCGKARAESSNGLDLYNTCRQLTELPRRTEK